MRLKQKYFVPFMVVVAIITTIVIILSSFNFQQKQQDMFRRSIAESDSLDRMQLHKFENGERVAFTLSEFHGDETLVVFWATWSEKSASLLEEIEEFRKRRGSFPVIAALVMDAEESIPQKRAYPDFVYADGTHLFNYLKVPGIPSYMLLDSTGAVLHAHIGYQKSAGYDTLKVYMQ